MMGFELTLNFNNPLAATNLIDFWTRWHLSLTSWIRTYLFYPMMRSRLFGSLLSFNIVLMFVFSGLWHGASSAFVIWGLLNGIVFLMQRKKRFLLNKQLLYVKMAANILLVSAICIFFRAETVGQAWEMASGFGRFRDALNLPGILERLQISGTDLMIDLMAAGLIIIVQAALRVRGRSYAELERIPDEMPGWARWVLYYALIFAILLLGVFTGNQFVYFQF
jgi:D-alanyl-lipoteichoic acid acyltransferase DltB (MBOAT superfamily)